MKKKRLIAKFVGTAAEFRESLGLDKIEVTCACPTKSIYFQKI